MTPGHGEAGAPDPRSGLNSETRPHNGADLTVQGIPAPRGGDTADDPAEAGLTIAERFARFDQANPRVYSTLVRLAREWVAQTGRRKVGIATLYETARWHIAIATSDPDYKLNNNFRSFYARKIMREERDLHGLFDLRRSAADEWAAGRPERTGQADDDAGTFR